MSQWLRRLEDTTILRVHPPVCPTLPNTAHAPRRTQVVHEGTTYSIIQALKSQRVYRPPEVPTLLGAPGPVVRRLSMAATDVFMSNT